MSTISTNTQWEGQFSIDQTIGKNTAIALRTPTEGSFTVTFTDPSGQQMTLQNEPEITNWNDVDSEVGISWMRISDPAVSKPFLLHFILLDTYTFFHKRIRLAVGGVMPFVTTPLLVRIANLILKSICKSARPSQARRLLYPNSSRGFL